MKQLLRRNYRALLKSIDRGIIDKECEKIFLTIAEIVTELVTNHPIFLKSEKVSVFCSMNGEINTSSLIQIMFDLGKKVFIPRCHGNEMQMVLISSFKDYLSIPINSWGIREPLWDADMKNATDFGGLDLIIMPGLVFDKSKARLGHGRGYLFKDNQAASTGHMYYYDSDILVAIALSEQIIDDGIIPLEDHDIKPDLIFCPLGVL